MRAAPRRSHDVPRSRQRRSGGREALLRDVRSRYVDFPLTPGDSAPQKYDSPLPPVVSSRNRTANQFLAPLSTRGEEKDNAVIFDVYGTESCREIPASGDQRYGFKKMLLPVCEFACIKNVRVFHIVVSFYTVL